jgi:hypothetical protein
MAKTIIWIQDANHNKIRHSQNAISRASHTSLTNHWCDFILCTYRLCNDYCFIGNTNSSTNPCYFQHTHKNNIFFGLCKISTVRYIPSEMILHVHYAYLAKLSSMYTMMYCTYHNLKHDHVRRTKFPWQSSKTFYQIYIPSVQWFIAHQ